jgi:hypothetical protein
MPKMRKNPAAVLLGQLSGLKRRGESVNELLSISRKRIHLAARKLGAAGGLKGGAKGGKARGKKLSASVRRAIASDAARTRWSSAKIPVEKT